MDKIDQLISKFKSFKEELAKAAQDKGVHVSSNPSEPGRSTMGILARLGEGDAAKEQAKSTLKEMKKLPKPKLVKSEQLTISTNGQWSLD